MPLLDVTDIILDADFLDSMSYTRNVQSVDTHGIASVSKSTNNIYGVVTSDKGDVLYRSDGSSVVKGTILVHTIARLKNAGASNDADIVTWNGNTYTVMTVNDYSRYGRGFVCATCELIELQG